MPPEESSTELKASVEAFLANLRRRGKAARTIKRWSVELDRFVAWVGDRELHEIDAGALELGFLTEWEAAFRDRNGRAPALNSTRAAIQAVKSFYAFMDRFGLLVDADSGLIRNPALALELPVIPVKPELDWLPAEEDKALLSCSMSAREGIVVFFLRMTGLRLGEALALTNRDVDVGARCTASATWTLSTRRASPRLPRTFSTCSPGLCSSPTMSSSTCQCCNMRSRPPASTTGRSGWHARSMRSGCSSRSLTTTACSHSASGMGSCSRAPLTTQ